ncbi:MAG: hypothetical protein KKF56_04655 [Nanoarchaeota archaeon]|nr:hypothetical protein [Nanoarchaeota archaeon]
MEPEEIKEKEVEIIEKPATPPTPTPSSTSENPIFQETSLPTEPTPTPQPNPAPTPEPTPTPKPDPQPTPEPASQEKNSQTTIQQTPSQTPQQSTQYPSSTPMKRNIAFKYKIGDLTRGNPIMDGERFSKLDLNGKEVVRVNIIANVIDKFISETEDRKFGTLTLDDASGQIRIKLFGDDISKFENLTQGQTILVIGTLRFYNNELYINPEIIKQAEPKYLLIRKLEVEKAQASQPQTPQLQQDQVKQLKDQIIEKIKSAEAEGKEGIDTEQLIMDLKDFPADSINKEIQNLLEQGVAYEPKPGKIRFLGV